MAGSRRPTEVSKLTVFELLDPTLVTREMQDCAQMRRVALLVAAIGQLTVRDAAAAGCGWALGAALARG